MLGYLLDHSDTTLHSAHLLYVGIYTLRDYQIVSELHSFSYWILKRELQDVHSLSELGELLLSVLAKPARQILVPPPRPRVEKGTRSKA